VIIQTPDSIDFVKSLDEVVDCKPHENRNAPNEWELTLKRDADPQKILQFCFSHQVRLQSFFPINPTLHEVFMHLVGPEAREAVFR
jgi:ABC-2 type transport system ATP-binding protein